MKVLNEDTSIKISIKTLIAITLTIATAVGGWYTLQQDIEEAKELPVPEISVDEYKYKDELTRQTFKNNQEDVKEIKQRLILIETKLSNIKSK